MDAYGLIHGHTLGIVTGKPLELGGSVGRDAAIGRGALFTMIEPAIEPAKDLRMDPEGARVAVHGFWNAGSWTARLLQEIGCKVVAVSDTRGGIYNEADLICRAS